jgi:hypothetical protein
MGDIWYSLVSVGRKSVLRLVDGHLPAFSHIEHTTMHVNKLLNGLQSCTGSKSKQEYTIEKSAEDLGSLPSE